MEKQYEACMACPRGCGINRNEKQVGACGETADLRIAWAGLHFGEEPPVTGEHGSGTVFVTGCNLGCAFCQNFQISRDGMGRTVEAAEFAEICLALAEEGAENINIVTGSHAIPSIASGLRKAKNQGLAIPILWNSSAYETTEALSLLDGLVTVWLPDLKTLNPLLSENVFRASDYPKVAKKAIRYMADKSPLKLTNSRTEESSPGAGKIISGVIVRHLALPGRLADTELVLRWFAEHLKDKAILSLMTQYTPVKASPYAQDINAFPDRLLDKGEYKKLTNLLEELDIDTGFYQELVDDTDWLPDFNRQQPFSSKLAKPVWHWSKGFSLESGR
jgi:putative pyruvate formate lyase activating enzyme